MHVAKTQERRNVGLVGLGCQGVAKENNKVELTSGKHCSDLLVAAERAAVKASYGKSRALGNHFCRSSRSAEEMMLKYLLIFKTPCYKLLFFIVVGNKGDKEKYEKANDMKKRLDKMLKEDPSLKNDPAFKQSYKDVEKALKENFSKYNFKCRCIRSCITIKR